MSFRALAHRDGEHVEIISKNGQPLARYFQEIAEAVARIPTDAFSLDGELVVPLGHVLAFDALQKWIHPAASRVALLARTTPARYLVFDVPRLGGVNQIEPTSSKWPRRPWRYPTYKRGCSNRRTGETA